MASDTLALDIGSTFIKLMVGNRQKIKMCDIIKTPDNAMAENRILDTKTISDAILSYIKSKNIKVKNVSFVIHGEDIIVRHTETPIIDENGVRNSVEWEVRQYLPEDGLNHYISYEILDKIMTTEKSVYKILAVAAPKDKIESYLKIAENLKINIKAIDIFSNCIGRAFRELVVKMFVNSVGIIDMGGSTANMAVLDRGKLFIEREVPFGLDTLIKNIEGGSPMPYEEAFKEFSSNFSFNDAPDNSKLSNDVLNLFNEAFTSFEKIVEFYAAGKLEKALDQIYVIGGASGISGIDKYVNDYLKSPATVINDPSKLYLKVALPKNCDIKFYLGTLGLLLRKE